MAQTAAAKSRIHGQNAQSLLPADSPRARPPSRAPSRAKARRQLHPRAHATFRVSRHAHAQAVPRRRANPCNAHGNATPTRSTRELLRHDAHQTARRRATAALAARHNTRRRRIAQLCHARRGTVARLPPRRTRETSDAPRRARWQRRAAAHLKLRQKWTFEILKEVARLRCL